MLLLLLLALGEIRRKVSPCILRKIKSLMFSEKITLLSHHHHHHHCLLLLLFRPI